MAFDEWPCVRLDATDLRQRQCGGPGWRARTDGQGGGIASGAVLIAMAANPGGRREIIGLGIGPSQAETFRTDLPHGLSRSADPMA